MKKILSLLSMLTISGAHSNKQLESLTLKTNKQLESLTLKIEKFEQTKNNLEKEQTELQNKINELVIIPY
ncbi:hypothetical protein C6B38_00480 [Spiroplasma sp. ChiS]|uniref:hypothetical protein n=1 Tax=Spiroplasma sp. ChiS TaxID=2099885 RepID=UPI000CF95A0D|nr:hypothetical protein [Spiroplasma sp. ChiS]PQP79584.1 hypothetical protein C6B38_00480 [Spiroplasma sp. ChiS]